MAHSRRDFFSTLAAAVLALLGWRQRPTSAAPGPQPPAPAASHTSLSPCRPKASYTVTHYDAQGRVICTCDTWESMGPEEPVEQRDSDDACGTSQPGEQVRNSYDYTRSNFLDPAADKQA